MEFNFKTIKLDEILANCINEQLALMKSLSLTTNVEIKTPTTIVCDDVKIGQVIINMLSNAIKFSDKNSIIEIKIASETLALSNGKIEPKQGQALQDTLLLIIYICITHLRKQALLSCSNKKAKHIQLPSK